MEKIKDILAWVIVGIVVLTMILAPVWLWAITGDINAFYGTGFVLYICIPIICAVIWAFEHIGGNKDD